MASDMQRKNAIITSSGIGRPRGERAGQIRTLRHGIVIMSHRLLAIAALVAATLATACASLDPSSPSGVQIPYLVGTWTSGSISQGGSSCTNFQWTVTAQSGNSLTGQFSATCVNGITATGTVTGTLNGMDVPYQVNATATLGLVSCPITLSGTGHIEGDTLRIPYDGSTCLGPAHGEEVLHR